MRILTHPKNVLLLRRKFRTSDFDGAIRFAGIEILSDPRLPESKPTGRYVLPGGQVVDREAVRVKDRWAEYGPEDLRWLLYAGVVCEETEPLFYEMAEPLFRTWIDFVPTLPPAHVTIRNATL